LEQLVGGALGWPVVKFLRVLLGVGLLWFIAWLTQIMIEAADGPGGDAALVFFVWFMVVYWVVVCSLMAIHRKRPDFCRGMGPFFEVCGWLLTIGMTVWFFQNDNYLTSVQTVWGIAVPRGMKHLIFGTGSPIWLLFIFMLVTTLFFYRRQIWITRRKRDMEAAMAQRMESPVKVSRPAQFATETEERGTGKFR
jgi:hypothetical protein